MDKKEKSKYETYLGLKRYLKMSRLFSTLVAIFVIVFTLHTLLISLFWGLLIIVIALGFLWWIVMDIVADRFEARLVDFMEIHKINDKKHKGGK